MQFLLVDDHSLFRQGLSALLKRLRPAPLVSQARSGKEALDLAGKTDFDLVLLDLHLPDLDGRSVLKRLLKARPACRVLILSGSGDGSSASACLKAGAVGYLSKTLEAEALLDGIKGALTGGPIIAAQGPKGATSVKLPPSQLQVLRLLCLGRTNKEIAAALGLSANTIRNHLAVIFRSLDVRTRTEAAHQARILGIV
jgi:two-component system nitrate/nitrite response regulator NarL